MLIDRYAYGNRWRTVHPLAKGAFAGFGLTASLVAATPSIALLILLVMAGATVCGARIPPRFYLRLLLVPAGFLLAGVGGLVLSFSGGDLLLLSVPLCGLEVFASFSGLHQAGLVLARALGAVASLYLLALTTPMTEVVGLLRRLRVSSLLLELMVLAYRQIFIFAQIAREMRIAQLSRLGYATTGNSFRSLADLGANLYLRAHHRSKLLHRALLCRGYEGDLRWLEREHPRSSGKILLAAAAGGGLLALALLVRG